MIIRDGTYMNLPFCHLESKLCFFMPYGLRVAFLRFKLGAAWAKEAAGTVIAIGEGAAAPMS